MIKNIVAVLFFIFVIANISEGVYGMDNNVVVILDEPGNNRNPAYAAGSA